MERYNRMATASVSSVMGSVYVWAPGKFAAYVLAEVVRAAMSPEER